MSPSRVRMQPSTDRFDDVDLRGGLVLVGPTRKLKPGMLRDALNFEQSMSGGYTRIKGYERYDGRPSPSVAQYLVLTVTVSGAIAPGDTIVGVTSAATGVVISLTDPADGSGNMLVAFTKATGTFVDAETLNVSGSPQGTVADLGGVSTDPNWDATQLSLAANVYRASIAAVPGSGPVRGVANLAGVRYAWRDNAGATAMLLYKSTSTGWTAVPLGYEIAFSGGSSQYFEGGTLTKGSATATIRRVCLESGSWGSSTASGRFILSSVTNGPFSAGAAVGTGACTLGGAETAITLLPGGRVETDFGNFGGGRRLYGCDGINRGFEFDGTYYVPIKTGMAVDKPTRVLVHKNYLWFAFNTNLLNSSIATLTNLYPQYNFEVVNGAVQYFLADTITALMRQPGSQETGAMSISLAGGTQIMYGSSGADFKPVQFEDAAGALPYGAQTVGTQTIVFGNIGVYAISATQAYGNFTPASMTMNIQPFTQVRRSLLSASTINKEKSQYRAFFSDGSGLYVTTVNGKLIGSMPVQFPNPVRCACQGDSQDGPEVSYFGSDNGFVYQLDAGTSHDGAAIDAYFTMLAINQGNVAQNKSYRGAEFEIQGNSYCEFSATYELEYGSTDIEQGNDNTTIAVSLSATFWDSFTWDAFTWDGRTLAPSEMEMDGTATNVAIRVASASAIYDEFTINNVLLRYKPRRNKRIGA